MSTWGYWLRTILQGGLAILLGLVLLITLVKCCLKMTERQQTTSIWWFRGPVRPNFTSKFKWAMFRLDLIGFICYFSGQVWIGRWKAKKGSLMCSLSTPKAP